MRILLMVSLFAAAIAFARGTDLQQKLDLARQEEDTHAEIELLRRWLDTHPNDPAAVEELVGLWLEVDDFRMALQTLSNTASPDPGLVARTHAEVALKRDEKLPAALQILRDRTSAAPKDRQSRLMLAEYLAKAGETKDQIDVLDSLLAEEDDADLLVDRAGAKLLAGDPKGALVDFRRAAAAAPDEPRIKISSAGFDRLESALAAIAILDKAPATPQAHFNKSYFWFYGGAPNAGLNEAAQGLGSWPESVYGRILETRGLVANGSLTPEKAREERHVNVSTALEDEKARRGILEADAALAKNPGNLQQLVNRASWLNYADHYALGMDDVATVLKSDPSNIPALHYAVALSLREGNFPAATAYAEKLKMLKASREILSDVYAGLAQSAFEQSKFPLALDFAERSIEAKPLAHVWKLKSACHTRLGQPNEAAEAMKQAEKKGTR